MLARLALEQRAARIAVDPEAAAARTDRVAGSGRPADFFERLARLFVRHAGDLREGESASGGREKEVLSHNHANVLR